MATTPPSDEEVLGRIDDLEAMVNGLMIYIAAKEAGVDLDASDPKVRDFIKSNVLRPQQYRLKRTGAVAEDGYHDAAPLGRIRTLRDKLKAAK